MDELFSLYTLLRGLEETSDKLEISKQMLKNSLHVPGSFLRNFFDRVLECIQEMALTSSLEDASAYFYLPPDFLSVLFDPVAELEYIEKFKQKFESSLNSSLAYPAIQGILNTTVTNLNNSVDSDVDCSIDQSTSVPLLNPPETSLSVLPTAENIPIIDNQIQPILPRQIVQPEEINVSATLNARPASIQRFPSTTLNKKVDVNSLSKHFPKSGTIENPDYAFKLPSIT